MRWHTVIGIPAVMMGVLAMAQTTPFSGSWECLSTGAAFSPRDTRGPASRRNAHGCSGGRNWWIQHHGSTRYGPNSL